MQTLYTAEATAYGGRAGRATSSDDRLDVELDVPKELGGDGGDGTNPEQLFAAGYASCFHSALQLVARAASADTTDSTVTARVGLGPAPSGVGFVLTVELVVSLPALERSDAMELVAKAHQVCPYSNATRGNIEVDLSVAD
ncbi:MAG TPA: organic hydroperoxide resistance protein [Mycobacteriales bacterium]|nr:organic hydroperoxide resistance protein [Mycobacteriales bacterium]